MDMDEKKRKNTKSLSIFPPLSRNKVTFKFQPALFFFMGFATLKLCFNEIYFPWASIVMKLPDQVEQKRSRGMSV
jgi:hypothetical protein